MLGSVFTQMLIYFIVFLFFFLSLWQSLCSRWRCSELFLCLHFEQLWKCCSWLVEPGNLGICKVSTITKAINLDTIMQSGEEEHRTTGKATRKCMRGRKERRGCGGNADEMMADHHSEAVNGGARGPSTSVVFMINESSPSVVSGSLDRQIAG